MPNALRKCGAATLPSLEEASTWHVSYLLPALRLLSAFVRWPSIIAANLLAIDLRLLNSSVDWCLGVLTRTDRCSRAQFDNSWECLCLHAIFSLSHRSFYRPCRREDGVSISALCPDFSMHAPYRNKTVSRNSLDVYLDRSTPSRQTFHASVAHTSESKSDRGRPFNCGLDTWSGLAKRATMLEA